MAGMKHGLRLLLPVYFDGFNLDNAAEIEFVFTQHRDQKSAILKSALYKSDGTGDASRNENAICVPWTVEETALFRADDFFYMDTRITPTNGIYQPPTNIVKLRMDMTLFKQEEG